MGERMAAALRRRVRAPREAAGEGEHRRPPLHRRKVLQVLLHPRRHDRPAELQPGDHRAERRDVEREHRVRELEREGRREPEHRPRRREQQPVANVREPPRARELLRVDVAHRLERDARREVRDGLRALFDGRQRFRQRLQEARCLDAERLAVVLVVLLLTHRLLGLRHLAVRVRGRRSVGGRLRVRGERERADEQQRKKWQSTSAAHYLR